MKKSIALVLVLIFIMALAVGCTPPPTPEQTPAAQTPAAADEGTEAEPAVAIKAGFIYIGPADDGGFSTSHDVARKALAADLGIETVFRELVPEGAEVENVIDDMVDEGCNVIFGCSFGYMDYMEAKAQEYPDVIFLHCSGYKSNDTNFANYFGRMYQARFLSGLAAGLATQSNQIGYVAAFPIPEVIRGLNAFSLGVQTANSDATVEVIWTTDWVDATKAKEAANTLIDKGCDVIAQHQDATSPQQAAEEAGVYAVGYHMDMIGSAPNANIGSAVWNWTPYYKSVITAMMAGTFKAENYWGGMDEGLIDVVLTANAPSGAQALVDEYRAKIISGEWDVFTGTLTDNEGNVVLDGGALTDEQMLSMMWLNANVIGSAS